MKLPERLYDLILYRHPDCVRIGADRHSDQCYTVMVMDPNKEWTFWTAHLSLDGRWTLSPLY